MRANSLNIKAASMNCGQPKDSHRREKMPQLQIEGGALEEIYSGTDKNCMQYVEGLP